MKLTYKKGKGDKIHLSVDGEYALTVDEAFFYSLSLKENQEISSEELNELAGKIGERRAYNQAVALLSRRDHSEKELTFKLTQKGYGKYGENVVMKLRAQGFLDDYRFATLFVRELINLKGYGRRRIEQELMRKGVSREIITEVLSETEFSDERLNELIKKKYLRYLDTEKGVQKAVNGLLRLGYSYGEIRDALSKYTENPEDYDEVIYE